MQSPIALPTPRWVPGHAESLDGGPAGAGHAIAGFELVSVPGGGDTLRSFESRILFWELAWTLLEDSALEFRWVGGQASVRAYVLVRTSGFDREATSAECQRVAGALSQLMRRTVPGVTLRPMDTADVGVMATLERAISGERGDLVRRRVGFESGGGAVDVPIPLSIGLPALRVLLQEMAEASEPVCVSMVAGPTHIDELEQDVLEAELARVERLLIRSRVSADLQLSSNPERVDEETAITRVESTAVALSRRIEHYDRLGMLRLSISAAGEMPLTFRAAAQSSLGWAAGSLEYVPAAESGDQTVFDRNLKTLGFEPWGLMVEEEPARRTISDCYLASLPEVIAAVWMPPLDEATPSHVSIVDPLPRVVPSEVPREGTVLGVNRSGPSERPVALSDTDRSRHMYIIGQTGTGKSTLAARMALNDIAAGEGVCVIDPHGDLVDDILLRYPKDRQDDLIIFDPRDEEFPLGLNLFDTQDPAERDFAIQQIISMLYRLYDPTRSGIMGPRFEHWFRNAALTAMADPGGGTFLDIPLIFTNDRIRAKKIGHVEDPVVRSFWLDELAKTSDYHTSEMLGWFVGKFGAFLSNTTMRRILGQRHSAFDFRELMDSRKVLLVKLAKGQIGEINARILGMILVSKLQMAALSRANVSRDERRRFHLYVDEFQSLALSSFDELVAEARKYGLALTLMNQHVRQLPEDQRMALFGNVGTFCAFRLGLPDARLVADEFGDFSVRDLTRLENYRCAVRMPVDGRVQTPFDVYTLPLEPPGPDAEADVSSLTERSRRRWGTPADTAEQEALGIFDEADGVFRLPV